MPDPMLQLGSSIGSYRLSRLLGRGGMGVVYLADQEYPRRKVAVKVIAPEFARDVVFRDRFVREVDLAASLEHPHVLPIYEAGEAEGHLFLAMRYVDGSDLRGLLLRDGRLPVARCLDILDQIAGALDAAHERGLVHRDVKPANILIARQGDIDHAYLSDFGLAKERNAAADITQSAHLLGTLDYMAPEQIRGEPLNERVDVYALGCVLYQCFAGATPFRGTDVAVMLGHLQEPPPSIVAQDPNLPVELDAVVGMAMSKDRELRYSTCTELADAARKAASPAASNTPPTAARTVSPRARARRQPTPQRVRRGFVIGVALAVMLVIAGAAAFVSFRPSHGSPPLTAPLLETSRVTVEPFSVSDVAGGQLESVVKVISTRPGQCWEHSLVSGRPDAFRCIATNCSGNGPCPLMDPCFTPPVVVPRPRVACPAGSVPWTSRYAVFTLKRAPTGYGRSTRIEPPPWGLQLANGARCLELGNGRPLIGGVAVNYRCSDGEYAVGNIHRTAKVWTTGVQRPASTQIRQAPIRTAWY